MSKLLGSQMRTATHHELVVESSFFPYCLEPLAVFNYWLINVVIEFYPVDKVVRNVSCKHINQEVLQNLLFVFHFTDTFLIHFVVLAKLREFVIALQKFSHLSLSNRTALGSNMILIMVVVNRIGVGI